jgi:hypothetical protein
MSLNLRSFRIPTLAASAGIALTALAVTGVAAPAQPVQRAMKTCKPRDYPGSGYFTELRVQNVTCKYGNSFMLAYYNCRTKHGRSPRGRCTTKVLRFSCTEKRTSIATEIDARVTCHRGTQRIIHSYQQNIE